MSAGGDFELVFTVRPDWLDAARSACALTVIGVVGGDLDEETRRAETDGGEGARAQDQGMD